MLLRDQIVIQIGEELDGMVMIRSGDNRQEFRIAALERETKRKNIIIREVEDKENESKIVQKLAVTIKKEVDIDKAKRIGKYRADGQRPIVLKLTTGTKKAEILRNSKGLKG
ncbi:unnamed protein product [Brassicogethes aeneus]|uniref:STAC3-related SH3 domain-containing protein n=1 Tax=Brassicogethes aeneus TaxID=1431903 RepID=A0A9P0B4W8_BRAAE|nr:unnamed protein product [Brassicogethes aeneus]